ncbi:uncharacterized protein [Periplaneta americana]|uniref:uncharacterized protein n=1 Tax=Periplaneta americana TaxID=6978 RepID=UPI0037E7C40B
MGEQSEKNTKPTERLKFEKTKGCADGAGQEYEIKVPALLFLRALQHTQQFRIATNFAEAGAFDDVVIAYKKNDSEKWITCFIQLKHKTSKYPITFRDLTNLKKIGDFNLIKYYKSYTEIKERFRDVSREHPVFQGDYEDSEYVIFTNAKMNPQLSQRHRQSHSISQPLLQVNSEASAVFSFNETSDDDIFQYFKDVSHFKEFLESVDLENISEEELLNKTKQLKTSLSKESLKTIGSITRLEDFRRIKCQLRDLEDCRDFLRNVSFFVDQPNEEQMDGIIQEEIQKLLCTNEIDTVSIWKEMYEAISIW